MAKGIYELNSLIKKAVGYIRFLQKEYLWKNRGMESKVVVSKECGVVKYYNDLYYRNNLMYNRRGEPHFYLKYKFDFMPEFCYTHKDGIAIGYSGEPIGKRYITRKDIPLIELVKWLNRVEGHLSSFMISHRDINPSNICYNEVTNKFTLIDWAWATEVQLHEDGDVNYKRYRGSDSHAIKVIQDDCIRLLCKKLGVSSSPGSSIFKGYAYHTVPFIDGVKSHKTAVEFEFQEIVNYCGSKPRMVLDIGSSVGYNSVGMARFGSIVFAYDPDQSSCDVLSAIYATHVYNHKGTHPLGIYVNNEEFTRCTKNFDLAIMMNVSMWIHKKYGMQKLDEIMSEIAEHCKTLVYQTAHAESRGDYVIEEFKNKDDIRNHLLKAGFKSVEWIRDTGRHGGIRSLFVCKQ